MTGQLDFFYTAEQVPSTGTTIEERFKSFNEGNPHVYRAICILARDLVSKGATRLGMKMLFEYLRVSSIRTNGREFKLNNSYTSRYARLVVEQEADLAPRFELRRNLAA